MRKIIYPQITGGFEKQLNDCLDQLNTFMDKQQVYPGSFIKHNVYINIDNQKEYAVQKSNLLTIVKRRFPLPVVLCLIPQAPAGTDIALESIYINSATWNGIYRYNDFGACQILDNKKQKIIIGSVQADSYGNVSSNTEAAYNAINDLLSNTDFKLNNLIRNWNYVENILELTDGIQNYQAFNKIRTETFDDLFETTGYPAASTIGTTTGGVIIQFIGVLDNGTHSKAIDNSLQKSAYNYSTKALLANKSIETNPSTPKFERARTLEIDTSKTILISGTASITGERTVAKGEIAEQTKITIDNIDALISKKNLAKNNIEPNKDATIVDLTVYVKHAADLEKVDNALHQRYGNLPVLLLQTDLCRNNLLVEIEGEATY